MFAHRAAIVLKPNNKAESTQKFEKEILRILREQEGFQDEISFVTVAGKEVLAISLQDSKKSADSYHNGSYVEVTRLLSQVVDGTPQVITYEVINSTVHKIDAALKAT